MTGAHSRNKGATFGAADMRFFADIGWTSGEAAGALGVAPTTVRKRAAASGVEFPNKPAAIRRFHKSYSIVSETYCWIWTGCVRSHCAPYGVIGVDGESVGAHRFSYENYFGPIPQGLVVCHRCDVPECVNPAHLFLGTHSDNAADKVAKGRANLPKGEAHHACKLKDADVAEIFASQKSGAELARHFRISQSTITKYRKGLRCVR